MIKYKWTPKELDKDVADKAKWKGEVEIKIPNYMDRMRLLNELKLKVKEGGSIDFGEDIFEGLAKMGDVVKKHISLVALEYSDIKIESTDQLLGYEECSAIVQALASRVLSGARLSKN